VARIIRAFVTSNNVSDLNESQLSSSPAPLNEHPVNKKGNNTIQYFQNLERSSIVDILMILKPFASEI